jgi:hypothetical protein
MRVARLALSEIPPAEYDALVSESFFASRGFLEVWRAMGGRPVAWVVEAGGSIAALLPGVEYGIGPVLRFASLPDGCYGGLFVHPDCLLDRERISTLLLDGISRRGYAKCHIYDYAGHVLEHKAFAPEPSETLLVDIGHPDWMPCDKNLRTEIRRAAREGIRVEPFDWARHETGFLSLVRATAERHGEKPRYRARLYQRLAALAERDPRIRWRWCEHGGRPVASQIYFIERGTLMAWQECFDKAFAFLKPNQYIRWTVCREVASEGVRWLNLGATPLHAGGVRFYKERWGGERTRFLTQTRWDGLGAFVRRRDQRAQPADHETPGETVGAGVDAKRGR